MIFVYDKSVNAIEEELYKKNNLLIEKSIDSIDQSLLELNMVLYQLESNPKILNYRNFSPPLSGGNVIRSLELKEALGSYGIINQLFYDYYILFNKNNMVIGPNIISTNEQFYKSMINYDNLGDDNIFREIFLDYNYQNDFMTFIPAQNVFKYNPNKSLITVVRPIKHLTNKNIGITIIFFLDNRTLQDRIKTVDINDNSQMFILNAKNNELLTSSVSNNIKNDYTEILYNDKFMDHLNHTDQFDIEYMGNKLLVTSVFSKDKTLKLISIQPLQGIVDKLSAVKSSIFIFIFTSGLLSLLIISILFFTNGVPARKLLKNISTSENLPIRKIQGIFNILLLVFSEMSFKNSSLSQRLEDQKKLLEVSFFERLYNGNFSNEFEVEAMIKSINLNIYAQYYTAAIIYINDSISNNNSNKHLNNYSNNLLAIESLESENVLAKCFHLYNLSENKIAVLIKGNSNALEEEKNNITITIKELYNALKQIRNLDCYIYVGSTCNNILDVSFSMNAANRCMNYGQTREHKNKILFYEDIVGIFSGHYYPRDLESKLINSVLNADIQETVKIIENVFTENTEYMNLPSSMILLISHELCATLFRTLDSGHFNMPEEIIVRLNNLINIIDHKTDLEIVKTTIIDLFRDCCYIIGKRSSGKDFIDSVIEFLKTNYHLADISLDTLTDMFDVSQAHLSKLFKERTGNTFYEYLEKTRMEVACKMLSETTLSIKDVGLAVGYLSSNTFCRAFKRYSAISAGKYREIYNQKNPLETHYIK